jgi:hypothetical protein
MTSSDSRPPNEFSEDVEITNTSGRLRVAIELTVAALILVGIYYLFAPEEQIELQAPIQESQIDPIIRAQIEAAEQEKETEPNSPTQSAKAEVEQLPQVETTSGEKPSNTARIDPVTPQTAIQDGESARELITKLRRGKLKLSAIEMLAKADSYTQQGKLSDAYLLLFYAAREGDGQAAFALASLHDPHHFSEGNTLLEKPDIFQAHKWYREAAKQQVAGAQKRLEALRGEIERQADTGDPSAQRLLLNWR